MCEKLVQGQGGKCAKVQKVFMIFCRKKSQLIPSAKRLPPLHRTKYVVGEQPAAINHTLVCLPSIRFQNTYLRAVTLVVLQSEKS